MSDFDEMNLGPRWYVIHTYSGYENKVKTSIDKIVENRPGDVFGNCGVSGADGLGWDPDRYWGASIRGFRSGDCCLVGELLGSRKRFGVDCNTFLP